MDSRTRFTGISKGFTGGMVALLAVGLAATPAVADDGAAAAIEATRWAGRPVSVSAHIGLGTPYGSYGGELEVGLAPWATIAAGAGRSGTFRDSTMVAGAGRVRHVFGGNAVGLSLGLGYGDSTVDAGIGDDAKAVLNALWLNAEAYYEHRFGSGLMLRGYIGGTRALSFDTCVATTSHSGCGAVDSAMFPALGLAVGTYF